MGLLFGNLAAFGQSSGKLDKSPMPRAALDHLRKNQQRLQLANEDIADVVVSSQTVSKPSGVKHVYLQQRYQGIEIYGALSNVNLTKDDQVLNLGDRFQKQIGPRIKGKQAQLSAPAAVAAAVQHLNLALKAPLVAKESSPAANRATVFSTGGISLQPIPARLVYQPVANGQLVLAWEVSIYELDARNWWNVRVDAATGAVLDKDNLVVECNFDNTPTTCSPSPPKRPATDRAATWLRAPRTPRPRPWAGTPPRRACPSPPRAATTCTPTKTRTTAT
jgi:Zn-dependent metalloprotease